MAVHEAQIRLHLAAVTGIQPARVIDHVMVNDAVEEQDSSRRELDHHHVHVWADRGTAEINLAAGQQIIVDALDLAHANRARNRICVPQYFQRQMSLSAFTSAEVFT